MSHLQPHLELVFGSYERLLGRPLVDGWREIPDLAAHLETASFALLSHGTEDDPVFNYANRFTLELFEMDWDTFTRTPSRFSAEPLNREERQALLERVTRDGYIDDYAGVRISASGRRFRIVEAVVWNLVDEAGMKLGQAATFDRIEPTE